MLPIHILKNLMLYFLPLAISSTIALLTSEKIRAKRKIILWGNFILFVIVIIFSIITLPEKDPLQVEWAFYGLKEKPISSYEIHPLLGEGMPTFLDLENKLGEIKGLPIVHSGEQAQMRFHLNRKGYIYIFHLDTTFSTFKQLFPSDQIQQSNPVPSNSWVEIPPGPKTWRFDPKPGLEVFLCYISLKKSNDIKEDINKIIDDAKISSSEKAVILDSLQKQLSSIAPINFIRSGEYKHNLTGIIPEKVKTNVYQARNKQSALLLQFIHHKY